MTGFLRAYGRNLLFFVAVSLSWLGALAGGPVVDPVADDESLLKSLGYAAGSLVAWAGLVLGGLWLASSAGPLVLVTVLLVWGFLVAPVVVVVAMRLLFPGISRRLQAQVSAG
jgi:hypothetical protein